MTVKFSFLGVVLPETPPLTIDHQPTVVSEVLEHNPAELAVTVQDGRFEVRIRSASFNEQVWHGLFGPASDLARVVVEATGFVRAIPYVAFIDTLVRPDGTQKALTIRPGAPVRLVVHRDLILKPWQR